MMLGLTEECQRTGWWHSFNDAIPKDFDLFVGLEEAANRLFSYQSTLMPGLLQTLDYRRALAWAEFPNMETVEVERRIGLAIQRQERLTSDANPVALEAVIEESALRRPIGGSEVMSAQLRHLIQVGKLSNVSIRVVPVGAGAHQGLIVGPFVLLEFPPHPAIQLIEPPVVYVQGFTGALYLEKPAEIDQYRGASADLRRVALSETKSRTLIREIAEELTR